MMFFGKKARQRALGRINNRLEADGLPHADSVTMWRKRHAQITPATVIAGLVGLAVMAASIYFLRRLPIGFIAAAIAVTIQQAKPPVHVATGRFGAAVYALSPMTGRPSAQLATGMPSFIDDRTISIGHLVLRTSAKEAARIIQQPPLTPAPPTAQPNYSGERPPFVSG